MKNAILKFYLFIFFVFSQLGFGVAQTGNASATLDTTTILVGDQVKLSLKLVAPNKSKVIFPEIKDTLSKHIEVIAKSKIDTIKGNNEFTYKQQLLITAFDSGYYPIVPIPFLLITNEKDSSIVETNPLLLTVKSVPVDTTLAIKDIKGPLHAPLTLKEVLPYVLAALLAVAIIVLIIFIVRKIRRKEPIIALDTKPALPAHVIALTALEKLKQEKLWQAGHVKEYYSQLTDILRTYLFNRFEIDAMEMTTEEIIHNISGVDIPNDTSNKLIEILVLADLVKFAKEIPLPDQNDNVMVLAFDFINNTIQNEPTTVTANDNENNPKEIK